MPQSYGRSNGVLRKKTISKADISEPSLISFTSNVDTVDLPEGASLKNGMDEPPPVPPINPRRRATKGIFRLGPRKDSEESAYSYSSRSKTPDAYSGRSMTPDPWTGKPPAEQEMSFEVARGNRSASGTRSPRMPKQSLDQHPAMRQQYGFPPSNGSPERMARSPAPPVGMEGGMF